MTSEGEKISNNDDSAVDRLTVERLFSSPPILGSPPVDLRFAPDNSYLTFRAAAPDDRERYDLFAIDIADGSRRVLIDPRQIEETSSDITSLTAEERAERERRRDFSHGITQYQWRPQHPQSLLLPINGQGYLVELDKDKKIHKTTALCPPGSRQSAFQFSPDGRLLAYVRQRDLYVLELASERETRITMVQSELETNGLADFLAAEEMHRFEGFWWACDATGLFYTHVDLDPVPSSKRLELDADGARTIEQRYPFAGGINPTVELLYQQLGSTQAKHLWRSDAHDEYLARIIPLPQGILILVQDRRQKTLKYLWQDDSADFDAMRWQEIAVEQSASWVNLTDDVHASEYGIVTTEETSGTRQAVLLQLDGQRSNLAGPTHINQVLACTQEAVFVTGWDATPLENHLFKISYDGSNCAQVTGGSGWHEITLNHANSAFIDRFSNLETMLSISHIDLMSETERLLHREVIDDAHAYGPYQSNHALASLGSIEASDGQSLYYRLTPPAHIKGRHAVIVYVYGGPGAQKVRNHWGTGLVQLFAQQGFGVLELDNRGSANRGRAFEAALYQRMGSVEVVDQVAGLKVLESTPWADLGRVGIYGHSYGGYLTLMSLSQAPDSFAAGVAVAPVCDWRLYDSHYTERFMGLPVENESGYREGNVLHHLDKLDAPLLLMHGMADDNVLFENSTMIMNRLQELGKSFELMTYPGAKHSMQERHVSIHRFNMILEFFRKHL